MNTIWRKSIIKSTTYCVSSRNKCAIGQFTETGLHEWMPFIIFCARSRESSQLPLPGPFLSGHCFTLCIEQWKLNLELRSNTNATTVVFAKITGGKVMEDGEKVFLHRFSAGQKIASAWKKRAFCCCCCFVGLYVFYFNFLFFVCCFVCSFVL